MIKLINLFCAKHKTKLSKIPNDWPNHISLVCEEDKASNNPYDKFHYKLELCSYQTKEKIKLSNAYSLISVMNRHMQNEYKSFLYKEGILFYHSKVYLGKVYSNCEEDFVNQILLLI